MPGEALILAISLKIASVGKNWAYRPSRGREVQQQLRVRGQGTAWEAVLGFRLVQWDLGRKLASLGPWVFGRLVDLGCAPHWAGRSFTALLSFRPLGALSSVLRWTSTVVTLHLRVKWDGPSSLLEFRSWLLHSLAT